MENVQFLLRSKRNKNWSSHRNWESSAHEILIKTVTEENHAPKRAIAKKESFREVNM